MHLQWSLDVDFLRANELRLAQIQKNVRPLGVKMDLRDNRQQFLGLTAVMPRLPSSAFFYMLQTRLRLIVVYMKPFKKTRHL